MGGEIFPVRISRLTKWPAGEGTELQVSMGNSKCWT